jgi:hypothetical protein
MKRRRGKNAARRAGKNARLAKGRPIKADRPTKPGPPPPKRAMPGPPPRNPPPTAYCGPAEAAAHAPSAYGRSAEAAAHSASAYRAPPARRVEQKPRPGASSSTAEQQQQASRQETELLPTAAQTRIVSVARIRLDPRKSVRPFKGIICRDISEFESHMPSHAVGLSVSLLVSAGCRKPSLALGHRPQSFLRLVKNLSSPERTDQRPQLKSFSQGPANEIVANLSHSNAAIQNRLIAPNGA